MSAKRLIAASAFVVFIVCVESSPIARVSEPIRELHLTDENLTRIPEYVANYFHVKRIKIIGTKIENITEYDLMDYKRLEVLDVSESGINVVNCTIVDNLCLMEIITSEGQEIECDGISEKNKEIGQYKTRNLVNSSCTDGFLIFNDTASIINGNKQEYLNAGSTFFQPIPVVIFGCIAIVMGVFFKFKCCDNQTEERNYKVAHIEDNQQNENSQF